MDSIVDVNSMLIECVRAIGKYESEKHGYVDEKKRPAGSKYVGTALWPDKTVQAAQTLLLNCLNPDRAEKLTPDQAFFIERLARDRGIHIAMEFRCEELGYQHPVAVVPDDRKEKLMQDFIDAQKALAVIAEEIKQG